MLSEQLLYKFVIYGDSQGGGVRHEKIIANIVSKKPDFVITVGDMVNIGGIDSLWKLFLKEIKPLSEIPYYPTIGNHETYGSKGWKILKKYFPAIYEMSGGKTYYTFSYPKNKPNSKFIILDSNIDYSNNSDQSKWLVNQLKSDCTGYLFVILHHPMYSPGRHSDNINLQKNLLPLFKKVKVSSFFSGHDHLYARQKVNGVWHVVSGGGGGKLTFIRKNYYKDKKDFFALVTNHYLLLEVYSSKTLAFCFNNENKLVDSFVIER